MKRISSSNTRVLQLYTPFLFSFFGLMFAVAMPLRHTLENVGIQFPSVIATCMLLACVIAWFARSLMGFADEVIDEGDALLVRRRGIQERVAISNIIEVRDRTNVRWPPRVVLILRQPSALGSYIVFCPEGGSRLSGGNPVANDLRVRLQRSRAMAS